MISGNNFRIISWNIQGGKIENKAKYLEKYHPDVVVLQEVASPEFPISNQCIWIGDNPHKGVAVITSGDYRILPYPVQVDSPNYFLPVLIEGPISLHLMGVWTHKNNNYVESLKDIFFHYEDFLKNPHTIVVGDFNSNKIWDHQHKSYSHSMMVHDFNRKFNLVSSYHERFGVNHGEEQDPTIFWQRNKNKQYHIDYCFVPTQSFIESVIIGNYEDWKILSDHRPLIVDLSF